MIDEIYGDLDEFHMGQSITELQEKNEKLSIHIGELTQSLEKMQNEMEEVKKINDTLKINISKLYNTAKADYERRTRQINELRTQLDDLTFRRNNAQPYKIPKRKLEPENNEDVSMAKRTKHNESVKHGQKENILKDEEKMPSRYNNSEKNYTHPKSDRDNKFNDRNDRDNKFTNRNERPNSYKHRRSRSRERRRTRSRSRERRRSGSRSGERRRRSPMRNSYHRTSRDRYKNRQSTPDDIRQLEQEKKRIENKLKKKDTEKSDSESVVSINSVSSNEDKLKRYSRNDGNKKIERDSITAIEKINAEKESENVVRPKEKVSEIEEGEYTDTDDSQTKLIEDQIVLQNVDQIKNDNEMMLENNENEILNLVVVKNIESNCEPSNTLRDLNALDSKDTKAINEDKLEKQTAIPNNAVKEKVEITSQEKHSNDANKLEEIHKYIHSATESQNVTNETANVLNMESQLSEMSQETISKSFESDLPTSREMVRQQPPRRRRCIITID